MVKESTSTNDLKKGPSAHWHMAMGVIALALFVAFLSLVAWLIWIVCTCNSDMTLAIVGGTLAIISAIVASAITQYYARKNTIESELREQKVPIYEEFNQFMLNTLLRSTKEGIVNEGAFFSFFQDFTPRIALWGSDEVLLAYQRFRAFGTDMDHSSQNNLQILFLFEEIVLAMRRDLGLQNAGFERGAILSLFIKDYERLDSLNSEQ